MNKNVQISDIQAFSHNCLKSEPVQFQTVGTKTWECPKSERAEIQTVKSSDFGAFPISNVTILAFHCSPDFGQLVCPDFRHFQISDIHCTFP